MLEFIALIIFIISFLSMIFLFVFKMPILKTLESTKEKISFRKKTREQIKKALNTIYQAPMRIHWDIFSQKALSKIRVLALKAENKSNSLLVRMRKESRQREEQKLDNSDYWQEVSNLGKKTSKKKE